MKIRVNPHNVEIIREQTEPINEKEIKISKCEFEFDDKITNDFVKEAYFTLNGETYKQIIQNNECEYPSEVLDKKGTLEIGVVAYKVENEQEIVRYNPSPDYFESWVGSLKTAENSEPITPSEMEQFEQQLQDGLNDINDKIDEVDEKLDGIDTAIEETNNLNLDVSDKVDGDVTVTLTKKDASTKTVVLSDGTSLEFNWDGTKLGIKTSDEEEYTYVDLQGIQGIPGPQGEPFRIKKTYSSVAEMNADFNNMEYGDYVMIASSVEVEDNAKLYTRGESQWIFITDFSGATGIRGETGLTPSIQIGTVVSGSTPSVTRTGTDENPILNFVLQPGPQGEVGPTGLTGNGISSIAKTSTSGLVDTYTITYTNGNTTTFDVSNGNGIDRIEKTATVGNKDTYTIYFTNGSTTTYEVSNGEVTREELEEEVDRLSMIYNAFPTTPGEGEEPSINGTAEVPFKEIGLKGNTSQESTTGKNLYHMSSATPNSSTSYTINNNNSIRIYNTSASWRSAYTELTVPAGDYAFSFQSTVVSGAKQLIIQKVIGGTATDFKTMTITNETTFTLDSETLLRFVFFSTTGTNVAGDVTYSNIQLEVGSSVTSFEPYTGGNPAPNPDYPYPVNVVTGDNEVKVEGKNLFGIKDWLSTLGATYTENSDGSITFTPITALYNTTYPIKPTDRCLLSYKITNGTGTNFRFLYVYEDGTITQTTGSGSGTSEMSVSTSSSVVGLHGNVIGIRGNWTTSGTFTIKECMLEQLIENVSPQPYEPYQSQTYPINLGSMELCKIGDYQDYLYKENGIWYKYGAIKKNILKPTTITLEENGMRMSNYSVGIPATTYPQIYCEYFRRASNYQEVVNDLPNSLGLNTSGIVLCNVSGYTTTTEYANLFNNNDIYVYFPLATPTITEITDTTLIEQLDNLEKAYSYDTQTNISQTNQDKPFIISYEAILSLKNVLEI